MNYRTAIAKLKVGKGLTATSQSLGRIGGKMTSVVLWYDRKDDFFGATLRWGSSEQKMKIPRSMVVTKGRSQWMTDNIWRLTPEGVDLLVANTKKALKSVGG